MNSPIIFHTQHNINCTKIINQFNKRDKYIKYYNKYLIPYHCKQIDHQKHMIYGKFVYPMWNTLERYLLTRNTIFNYSYMNGKDFIIEINPSIVKKYHIFGHKSIYINGIKANEHTLRSNSILLFSIDIAIAEPLIQNQLL